MLSAPQAGFDVTEFARRRKTHGQKSKLFHESKIMKRHY